MFTQVQSADVSRGMTSHHYQAFKLFLLLHLSAFSEAVSLARLVEAEIVSPYSGILINTDVGNPTAPLIYGAWEISKFYQAGGGCIASCVHIRG